MAATSISLRRVLDLDVPFTWQEAVAIVHEAAIVGVVNATRNGAPTRLDAESCFITRRGDLELPYIADVEQPDAALQLLRELLSGRDTPTDLEALAYGSATPDLTDDLAQFSRPNRRAEIAGLALRAIDADERAQLADAAAAATLAPAPAAPPAAEPAPPPPPAPTIADDELARLREQVATRTPLSEPVAPEEAPQQRPEARPGAALRIAASLAVVVAATVAWWQWSGASPTPPDAPAPQLPVALAPVPLDSSWHAVGRREADIDLGSGSRNARQADATLLTSGPRDMGRAPLAPSVAEAALDGAPAGPASEAAASSTEADAAVDALFEDDSVYSWTNPDVQPALMRYPRMPRSSFPEPGEPVEGPYFEVLVDQRGGVEAVRLRGPNQHDRSYYQARMMLSAAKAWQFAPARHDGRPVRYVVRVVPQ